MRRNRKTSSQWNTGEERLIDLLERNGHLDENEIIKIVLDAIRQWTATEELQDVFRVHQ